MKTHKCAYAHCLHQGEPVGDDEAIIVSGKYYHWDCIQTKNDIQELRDMYLSGIDSNAKVPVLGKVLNDLVFKYNQPLGYLKYSIKHFIDYGTKIKSPFTLLYLRTNKVMQQKYQKEVMGG